jgi:prepilin-type processing-associated H-X9-DG protein
MTKYILHGGFTGKDNQLNRAFFEEIGRDVPDGGTILLVYFASKLEDNSDKFKQDSEKITEQSHGKKFNFLFADKEEFLDQLKQADAAYFRGGSTDKLLAALRSYPDLKPLMKGKTVSGSSAGAYALAKLGSSHEEKKLCEGFGMVSLRVVCHYESPVLPPFPGTVELLEKTAKDLDLIKLKDYEWKTFSV